MKAINLQQWAAAINYQLVLESCQCHHVTAIFWDLDDSERVNISCSNIMWKLVTRCAIFLTSLIYIDQDEPLVITSETTVIVSDGAFISGTV